MANWIYYPQSSAVQAATLSNITGTCTNLAYCQNYRAGLYADVATVSSGEYAFKVDLGASTLAPNYFALINHNLIALTGTITVTYGTADNGTDFDVQLFTADAAAADTPIWLETFSAPGAAKRYYKVSITSIDNTAYFGCMFMGTKIAPSVTCNYGEPLDYDRSGTVVNRTTGGNKFGVQNYDRLRVWGVLYEQIVDADATLLATLESTVGGPLKPFIFSDDSGVPYYGRFANNLSVQETAAGLWTARFQLEEDLTS